MITVGTSHFMLILRRAARLLCMYTSLQIPAWSPPLLFIVSEFILHFNQPKLYVGRGMHEGMFALLKYTLFWIMLLISKLAFRCYVEKTEPVPSTTLDSTASSTTRQVVSKTTSLSPRTPSVTNGSKGRSSTSAVDRSSGLSGRRKVGAPESRDTRFIMLLQVEIKTGDDVRLDLRGHRFEVSVLVG